MYSVYIIQSQIDQSLYIGSTKDKERRLYCHNYGRTGYTSKKRPWKLIYFEDFNTRGEAVKREKYFKSLKNKSYLLKIIIVKGP